MLSYFTLNSSWIFRHIFLRFAQTSQNRNTHSPAVLVSFLCDHFSRVIFYFPLVMAVIIWCEWTFTFPFIAKFFACMKTSSFFLHSKSFTFIIFFWKIQHKNVFRTSMWRHSIREHNLNTRASSKWWNARSNEDKWESNWAQPKESGISFAWHKK